MTLVAHIGFVHGFAVGLTVDRPVKPEPPADWDDVLGSDTARRQRPAPGPARSPGAEPRHPVGRRMAHETAIHRLDAGSALEDVPKTHFSPEFANDGIDEFLTFLVPQRGLTIGVRITTPERMWTVGTPETEVSGAADDVYRALYGRPNNAAVAGDRLPAL
ncbi:MAG: hypothetical protein QOI78_1570 [Actinomycetota bacterium]|nr:hypothetical protein [Actinomycetota bacterium]